jgi:hypothetical protein
MTFAGMLTPATLNAKTKANAAVANLFFIAVLLLR